MELKIIARIYTDFKEKFGIPRQSGIAADSVGRIVFEKDYRNPSALRGIDGYSHLWLIWHFSEAEREQWSPTVRPPRLGGNKRVGVFATRSPYRPNPIALSSVKLCGIEHSEADGDVLIVSGADILDGTPIYDIKPYLKYTDSHEDAEGGFADSVQDYRLTVNFPDELLEKIPDSKRAALMTILENDPRPGYKSDSEHEYGMKFSDFEVFFTVSEGTLTVTNIKIYMMLVVFPVPLFYCILFLETMNPRTDT